MTSGGTLPIPTPEMTMPLPRRMPAGSVIVGPAIEPIWTNRVAWKCAAGWLELSAASTRSAGSPHR